MELNLKHKPLLEKVSLILKSHLKLLGIIRQTGEDDDAEDEEKYQQS